MNPKSFYRGHEIKCINEEWVYGDTSESVSQTHKIRACGNCGNHSTDEGYDSCLGTLKGVMNACCGHGIENDAYIQFIDGHSIYGFDAIIIMDRLKEKNLNK